jgi:uncharacterized protein (UPF0248 family)
MRSVYAPSFECEQVPQRKRHGNSAWCAVCRVAINPKRASRRQKYCSPRCRDEARRRRNFAEFAKVRYPSGGVPRPVKNSVVNSASSKGEFAGRGAAIPWHRIIEVEVVHPHVWARVVSANGVVCQVAQLAPIQGHHDVHRRHDRHHDHHCGDDHGADSTQSPSTASTEFLCAQLSHDRAQIAPAFQGEQGADALRRSSQKESSDGSG